MPSNRFYKKRKRTRSTLNPRQFHPLIIILPIIIIVLGVGAIIFFHKKETPTSEKYLGSSATSIPYYEYNEAENRLIKSSNSLPRGILVTDLNTTYSENSNEYAMIEYNGNTYYVNRSALVDSPNQVIQEKQVWVRTSATVYENETGAEIASFAKKGSCLEVVGYDDMAEDGSIGKYQVHFTDSTGKEVTGWVYGKYVIDNEADALAVNTEIYEIHKNRIYSDLELYGGSPTTLDWYPVEKPNFEDNPILETASAMYINIAGIQSIDEYIEIALENNVNAVVIDIKDELRLAYPVEEIKEISPLAYEYAFYGSASYYQTAVQKCIDAGLYVIGRIVTFKDTVYSSDHPEVCIESSSTTQLWPSAFSRDVWYYNLTIAKAAVEYCGFNEIQFDYVRFPETAYNMSVAGDADFKNVYEEEKAEAIQNFCYYAADVLHEEGVYVSVDVFGECVNSYVTAYGQYFPAISNVVDAISAMPYPDHYGRDVDTWSDPYSTLYSWAQRAALRQSEIPTPAIARTWVTAYDVPYWTQEIVCDSTYVAAQAQALVDGGLTGGFITWNSDSSLDKYELIGPAWNTSYAPASDAD